MKCENPRAAACPYEVGDILTTSNAKDPADRWPGTEWAQIKDRFLLAAGDSHAIGSTGGEEAHALTKSELPDAQIPVDICITSGASGGSNYARFAYNGISSSENAVFLNGGRISHLGNGQAHNNMPPYEAVFIWKRTK